MRRLIFCLVLGFCGAAMADELADANKALAARDYPAALQLFDKLASTGNPAAQVRLGEMYWYGEGVKPDRARGDALFAKAAASGNKDAIANLGLSALRAGRAAAIAYWTSGYDGADLTAGQYNCAAPAIPAVSKTNNEIKATNQQVAAWRVCHDAFVAHLKSMLPLGKAIPAEVAIVMSESETQQAKMHLDEVYAAVLANARANAVAVLDRRDQWERATVAVVQQLNTATDELRLRFLETERERLARAPMPSTRVVINK